MSVAVKQVESCFIRALMDDYERWALNPQDSRRRSTTRTSISISSSARASSSAMTDTQRV